MVGFFSCTFIVAEYYEVFCFPFIVAIITKCSGVFFIVTGYYTDLCCVFHSAFIIAGIAQCLAVLLLLQRITRIAFVVAGH